MKESKTNQELSGRSTGSSQRDSWTALQTELGLLSSPIEQEQVSVVRAVDQSENDAQNQEAHPEVFDNEIPPVQQATDGVTGRSTDSVAGRSTDSVAVNILMPENSESSGSQDSLKESDPFGFDSFDDCDIPQNAFASPRKSKAFRRVAGRNVPTSEASALAAVDMPPQEVPEIALFSETESGESGMLIDPLLSDELPTSLWQPRKSAPTTKTPTPTAVPSFSSDSLSKAEGKMQDTAPPPADDLTRHSSGKKRHERGNGRQQQEKSFDRRPREPMQDMPERDRREHRNEHRNASDAELRGALLPPTHRQPRVAASQSAFDDFTIDEPVDNMVDSSFDELAWEPKPASKGRNREPRKSFRQAEVPSFGEHEAEPKGFGASPDRRHDANDWLDDGVDMEMEQASPRAKQNRDRKSFNEKPEKREKFDKDARAAYEAEKILARRAREERGREEREESPPRPQVAPKRPEKPAKASSPVVPSQKIAVSSWDDAVRDIIEKNMQRHPAPKNDRPSSGRRGPRR